MDAQLKAKWVEALRSGKYQQARAALIERDLSAGKSFCCLGVLCDIQGTKWRVDGSNDGVLDGIRVRDVGRSYLSPEALARFGLSDAMQSFLASKNDDGEPFSKIADYIEANL